MSQASPPNDTNNNASLVLALIVFLCLIMIGVTGYMKHQLNRSEASLAAPERNLASGDTLYEKLLSNLGYGGFMAAAKKFANTADQTALSDMRQNVAAAKTLFDDRADQLPLAQRRDLQAIIDSFAEVATRAEASLKEGGTPFVLADVMPVTLALTTLDSRLQGAMAETRYSAQANSSSWSMGLMLVSWVSLVLAAAMAMAAWLTISNRQSAPMRALAQSVQNLAKGDLQTPIWGMERKDLIGELARNVDMARYHFGKLPDISLMSEQGPVQLKFEGETRSLFDAMMRNMTDDYERARRELSHLAETGTRQQVVIQSMADQVAGVIDELRQHGVRSDQTLQSVTKSISDSAHGLISTQEKAAIQINRIVPYMQDRASRLAEVTSLAGTQIASTLQSLLQTSLDLKQSVSQSQHSVQQLATDTGSIGERIFAALNLMQASGKVLQETTDSTQSRLNEALQILDKGGSGLTRLIQQTENRIATTVRTEEEMALLVERTQSSASQLQQAVAVMQERESMLQRQLAETQEKLALMASGFDTAQNALGTATQKITGDSAAVNALLGELRLQNEQLIANLKQNVQSSQGTVQQLTERSGILLQRLEDQITQQAQLVEQRLSHLASNSDRLTQSGEVTATQLGKLAETLQQEQNRYQEARQTFTSRLDHLGDKLTHQVASSFSRSEELTAANQQKLTNLADNADGILQRLGMLGQLTSTLGTVAGQLGQLLPVLGSSASQDGPDLAGMSAEMSQHWQRTLHEIEAMHDGLAQIVIQQKDQLETRLAVIDSKLKSALAVSDSDTQQTAIMNEIVLALGKINNHVLQLDEAVQDMKQRG